MIFKNDPEPTFSDLWYRVARTRPMLSPHARFSRQHHGPEIAYVVEEPATGQHLRLSEAAYFFIALLDGRRCVDDAWDAACAQLGDHAPTQRQCLTALASLQLAGLLIGDEVIATDMVHQRRARAAQDKKRRRVGNYLFVTLPLFNPQPMLDRTAPVWKLIYSRAGLALWLVAVMVGMVAVLSNPARLADGLNNVLLLDAQAVALMSAAFLLLRALHELGHATACHALGGRCTEIGLILIGWILPLPYCDASSSWRFSATARRVVVACAGMMVEIFIAAIAAVVWATTSDPRLASFCYNLMLVASIATLVFNLNPLLRFDGYYILSDLAGSPNLAPRSKEFLRHIIERGVFGVRGGSGPRIRDRAEAWLLGIFGLLATPYRLFVSVAVIVVVSNQHLALGIVLAAIMAAMLLIAPVAKGASYLFFSPRLLGRRARAIGITAALAAVLVVGLGLIPAPNAAYAAAYVEPAVNAPVRTAEAGFVAQLLAEPGSTVHAGQPILLLENDQVQRARGELQARVHRAQAEADIARTRSLHEYERSLAVLAQWQARLDRINERADRLLVRAPASGILLSAQGPQRELVDSVGAFAPAGTLVGFITSPNDLRIRASIPDREQAYVFGDAKGPVSASVRLRGSAARSIPATVTTRAATGSRDLASQSLATTSGGSVDIDPSNAANPLAVEAQFVVDLTPLAPLVHAFPGQRARVRFDLPPAPLASQWSRRAKQYFAGQLGRLPLPTGG